MPMAHLYLQRGKSPQYLQALAESGYHAMHEAYDVFANDRFVLIHQHESYEMSVDRDYLGGPRLSDFVLVEITAGRQRDAATKQAFYRRLVERLVDALGIDPEDGMVVIAPTALEDGSFGGGRAGITAQEQS